MQRNLPHIISQATSAPLLLEPAYARVFFCALGRESGINSLHIPGNNESLDQSDMALVTGDFMATGKPQARFYQVVNGIAVLPVTGTLVHKLGGMRPFSGMTGYDGVTARLQQAVSDPEVKGILLDIDSPGGQAAGAFDCADMIYRMREQKPVWALANETACSAAMLLAAACSHRLVTQTSRMGSIGVVMAHIRENDNGTYAITAVQHVPEKESIVDNGASFDPQSGTIHGTVPPAIQHLTTEILAEEGQYQVLARWDTPRVVKGVSFSLRLNVAAEDGSDRLVSSAGTPDTQYRFRGLTPGRYTLSVRAVNSQGQQGDPASTQFSISAPAAPSFIELTPGYFQITATPRQAVYDPTVQYEFWFSDAQITDIHQVENAARYLGTALYWIAASVNIRPGRDYYFYIRAVNQVGKSAFVEATGQASNDAAGYLDFFKGKITESHLGKELLEKVDLTEDNASKLQQFSKEWKDANDKWNAMWGVKIEQTKDGKYYVAGLGLSMEDTPDGKISQFLVAADRIAYINPANGNETPGFVMQGDQIIMNEAFLKYLSAPTITSGGNPPAFSLTPDGKLTAKNADISGHINAVSGSFTGEINATSGKFSGVIEAREFVGDICGSKVMQGVSIRATNDERSTSTRYTDSATYQIGKTITVMANCERNGGSGAITVTININGQVKTAEVMPYTAGIPAMYQTVVFSVYTTSPVVDISVSLRVRGQYTTEASVWPLVMVSRSGSNFTN